MPKISAGLLLYRKRGRELEFLLVHPGGPFWAKKDIGAWTIPKGEVKPGEEALETAKREFEEELGFLPQDNFLPLGSITQKSGKIVQAWSFEDDCDPKTVKSTTFRLEWPPGSGEEREFPEVDRAEFFAFEEAKKRINPAQIEFLEKIQKIAG